MRTLEVVVNCDVCWEELEVKTSSVQSLVFGHDYDAPPDSCLDVCEAHLRLSLSEMDRWAKPYTAGREMKPPRKVKKAVPQSQPVSDGEPRRGIYPRPEMPCPNCGKPYVGQAALSMHIKARHPADWKPRSKAAQAKLQAKLQSA